MHQLIIRFVFAATVLTFGAFGTALSAPAQGGIVYNALYDCGPNANQFEVLNCDGNICTLLYPKGNGGRGFKSKIARDALAESINGTYGGTRKPCTINGKFVKAPTKLALNPPAPKKRQPPKPGGPMVLGRYECWAYTGGHLEAAMTENFSLAGGGRYTDAGRHAGSYAVTSGTITFHGAALNGVQAKYIQGRVGSPNPPHVQFIGARSSGDECDGKG
jgi:hypothetical protein